MMHSLQRIFVLLCLLLLPVAATAGTVQTERTSIRLISEVTHIEPSQSFFVAAHVTLKEGWHTYWLNPGDSGMPMQLQWSLPEGFKAGPIHWLPPMRIATGPIMNYAYEAETFLLVPITTPGKLTPGKEYTLTANASWLVCKDICIPEARTISITLTGADKSVAGSDALQVESAVARLPMPAPAEGSFRPLPDRMIQLEFPIAQPIAKDAAVEFFPQEDGLTRNAAVPRVNTEHDRIVMVTEQGNAKDIRSLSAIVSITPKNASPVFYNYRLNASASSGAIPTQDATQASGLEGIFHAIVFAIIGGLILNIMPCVLPILSLKLLAVVKKAEHAPRAVKLQGIAYTAGSMLCFGVLAAVLIAIQQGGQAVGWGFQMQSAGFVAAMAYLLFLVGLNLSGLFELPSIFANTGHSLTSKDSVLGSFATGVLAALIATPCTAPFMAPAIGYALTQSPTISLIIFISLGFGLALPFLLISFFPVLRRALPKPGVWMLHFKHFLAFPMYASALWLLWVLSQQTDSMGFAIFLAGGLLLAFGVWLLALLRERNGYVRLLVLLIWLSILAAPLYYLANNEPAPTSTESANTTTATQTEQPFSLKALEALRARKQSVLVDVTAAWCITCKVNERIALNTAATRALLARNNVTLMVADWTNRDAEITSYLQSFGREGVPLYVYYEKGAEPHLLPQLLTEAIVKKFIEPEKQGETP